MLQRLAHNWNLKITALVLAVALWSHVRGEVNPWETATFQVPLNALPPARTVVLNREKIPARVKITLRAPRSRLRELKGFAPANPLLPPDAAPLLGLDADGKMPVRAWLDWNLARRGEQTVPVKAEAISDDIEVIGSKPADVVVRLDRAAQKSFAVQILPLPARGYIIENARSPIDRATVSGPSDLLSRVVAVRARVRSGPLLLNGARQIQAPLFAVDERGATLENVRLEPQSVPVVATLRAMIITRRIRIQAIARGQLNESATLQNLSVSPSRVRLRGPQLQIETLNFLRVPVDLSRFDTSSATAQRRVRLTAPRGTRLIGASEIIVSARIQRAEIAPTATPDISPTPIATVEATVADAPDVAANVANEVSAPAENRIDVPETGR